MVPGKPAHLKSHQTESLKFTSAELPNALNLIYVDHLLLEMETIKFLGLHLDNHIIFY